MSDLTNLTGTARVLAGTLLATPGTVAAANAPAGVFYDSQAMYASGFCSAAPEVDYPFDNDGDYSTRIVRQKWQQLIATFAPPATGTPYALLNNKGFEVFNATILISPGKAKDLGGGVGEWERMYADVPASRTVLESFVYGFQYIVQDPMEQTSSGTQSPGTIGGSGGGDS